MALPLLRPESKQKRFLLVLQLMESGVNGALGVNVVNRVNKDSDHGAENVTHQFRSTMETPVMEIPNRRFHAMRIFLVQVGFR